ncbi:hypothetical protein BC936DRAFT_138992 [Jimgerdemannia flammicorona]|uniref:Sfi1 spindle body domain-containing protein n=1 Tax=Jimgerdemannia flammicorona TaxID=994334 RepID=A0A433DHZ0_9FUNG|nr:hypothetical protein BC936DRAFT_138992 [Jimgerdemannia flammicorona]
MANAARLSSPNGCEGRNDPRVILPWPVLFRLACQREESEPDKLSRLCSGWKNGRRKVWSAYSMEQAQWQRRLRIRENILGSQRKKILSGSCFCEWRIRVNDLSEQKHLAARHHERSLLRGRLYAWKLRLERQDTQKRRIKMFQDELMQANLRRIMRAWHSVATTSATLKVVYQMFVESADRRRCQWIMEELKGRLKIGRLVPMEKRFTKQRSTETTKQLFLAWRDSSQSLRVLRQLKDVLLKKSWHTWSKQLELSRRDHTAQKFYEKRLKERTMYFWLKGYREKFNIIEWNRCGSMSGGISTSNCWLQHMMFSEWNGIFSNGFKRTRGKYVTFVPLKSNFNSVWIRHTSTTLGVFGFGR